MKRDFAIAILFSCICTIVIAQSDGRDGPKGGSSSTAGSASNSSVTVNQNGGDNRQFIGALPGTAGSPGPIPGFVASAGSWHIYRPLSEISAERLRAVRKQHKPKEVHASFVGEVEVNDDPVHLVDWWPDIAGYKEDDVLGEVIVVGSPNMPLLEVALWGLSLAKEKTHSRRCAVYVRDMGEGVTSAHSFGSGFAASGISQSGSGFGGALGVGVGKSTTKLREHPEARAVCLNEGKPQAPGPEQPREEHQEQLLAPIPPQPAVQTPPPPPAPPTNLKVEAVTEQPPAVQQDPCEGMSEFVIYFDFDKYVIKDKYKAKIEEFVAWLKNHGACRLQVEGHTCTIGSAKYNANLGRSRAWAVYTALLKSGGNELKGQLIQPVSVTYDRPASEVKSENRRVILRVIGPATGK